MIIEEMIQERGPDGEGDEERWERFHIKTPFSCG